MVCLLVCHKHKPQNGWTNRDAICVADLVGPKIPYIRWTSGSPVQWAILRETGRPTVKYKDSLQRAVHQFSEAFMQGCFHWCSLTLLFCYKAASQYYIDATYSHRWSRVVYLSVCHNCAPHNAVWDVDLGGLRKQLLDGGAHWCLLPNTIEPFMWGGNEALCRPLVINWRTKYNTKTCKIYKSTINTNYTIIPNNTILSLANYSVVFPHKTSLFWLAISTFLYLWIVTDNKENTTNIMTEFTYVLYYTC